MLIKCCCLCIVNYLYMYFLFKALLLICCIKSFSASTCPTFKCTDTSHQPCGGTTCYFDLKYQASTKFYVNYSTMTRSTPMELKLLGEAGIGSDTRANWY